MDIFKITCIDTINKTCSYLVFKGRYNTVLGFASGSAMKNPPAMQERQEMLVRSWVRKIPLEKGMATHSSVLPGKFHGQRSMAARLQSMGPQSQTQLSDCHIISRLSILFH